MIYRKENKTERWEKTGGGDSSYFLLDDNAVLLSQVRDWARLERCNPKILNISLSLLNDNNKTFKQIADLIEKYL